MDKITLYSTHCPRCIVLEKKLQLKGIQYVECNDINEMIKLGIQAAPMLRVNDVLLDFTKAVQWINNYPGGNNEH